MGGIEGIQPGSYVLILSIKDGYDTPDSREELARLKDECRNALCSAGLSGVEVLVVWKVDKKKVSDMDEAEVDLQQCRRLVSTYEPVLCRFLVGLIPELDQPLIAEEQ